MRPALLVLAMLVGTVANVASAAASADPRAVVTSFYQWYYSPSPKNVDQGLKHYLAADTYALYERAMAEQKKTHKVVIDYDPFSGVQVGVYAVHVGAATVQGDTATVPVQLTVGLHKTDNLKRSLSVVVHKTSGTWGIWNVISSGKGEPTTNLRDDISGALSHS